MQLELETVHCVLCDLSIERLRQRVLIVSELLYRSSPLIDRNSV